MKAKIGKCIDCSADAPEKPLIAKRCQDHYWKHRREVNSKKPKAEEKKLVKKEQNIFFANQILEIPKHCEECGADLSYWRKSMPKAIIAHILPKRENGGFPSVATHPKNRLFICPTPCHADFDNKGESHAQQMKSLPIMRERFNEFKNCLTESELERVPNYLK